MERLVEISWVDPKGGLKVLEPKGGSKRLSSTIAIGFEGDKRDVVWLMLRSQGSIKGIVEYSSRYPKRELERLAFELVWESKRESEGLSFEFGLVSCSVPVLPLLVQFSFCSVLIQFGLVCNFYLFLCGLNFNSSTFTSITSSSLSII